MNESSKNFSSRPWLWPSLIYVFVAVLLFAIAIPNFVGGGQSKIGYVINNLRQIDGDKNEWVFEHGFTNAVQASQLTNQLTEDDLKPYLFHDGRNLIRPIAGEIYKINPMNKPPEALVVHKIPFGDGALSKGTVIRYSANTNYFYEIVRPDGTVERY